MTPWKILSVDDEPGVHELLRLALENYTFESQPVELLTANSAHEAEVLLKREPSLAVCIVDVVMETASAGLDLVRSIRQTLGNLMVRIVLRTGQTAQFPENDTVNGFEINDFWAKNETSFVRMRTSITTCLRGYRDLALLDRRTQQVRQWADRFPDLLGVKEWTSLVRLVVLRLKDLFPADLPSTFLCRNDGALWPMFMGSGRFPAQGAPDLLPWVGEVEAELILQAWKKHALVESGNNLALYFETHDRKGYLFFWEGPPGWGAYERHAARLVLQNFRAALDNLTLIQALEQQSEDLAASAGPSEMLVKQHRSFLNAASALQILSEGEDTSPLEKRRRRLAEMMVNALRLVGPQHSDTLDFSSLLPRWAGEGWKFLTVPLSLGVDRCLALLVLVRDLFDAFERDTPRRAGRSFGVLRIADQPPTLTIEAEHSVLPIYSVAWSQLSVQLGATFTVQKSTPDSTVWTLML
jgi:CheY-like chemotaxis protein